MNHLTRFSSMVLMGALILGTTACSDFVKLRDTPEIKAESFVELRDTPEEEVAYFMNSFYGTLEDESNYEVIAQAHENMERLDRDKKIRTLNALPGMEYFEKNTEEQKISSSSYLLANVDYIELKRGRFDKEPVSLKDVDITLPVEAITVDGDTAQVDVKQAVITVDGKIQNHENFGREPLQVKKNAAGEWVIRAPESDNNPSW